MTLEDLITKRFRGRPDHVAVWKGEHFEPRPVGAITPALIREKHLAGEQCLGFYLLDTQGRCWCSCVDFDNKPERPDPEWRDKAQQLYVALVHCQLSPLVELSQSGNGCHVWLFFDQPTPAWVPRAWWRSLLHRIEMAVPEIYPRQDDLSGKTLGNLVRFPLWNESTFVDVEDEWAALDPSEALEGVRPTSETDLKMLAFQLGMDELRPDPKVSVAVVGDIGEVFPLRVQKLTEKSGSLLNRRWNGDMGGLKDASKSALAMSIAVELVRQYVPTPEIASALRYWCRKNGAAHKGDRDDWVNLTVAKAYDFVVNRTEEKSVSAMTFRDACHAYLDTLEVGRPLYTKSGILELDNSMEGVGAGEVCVIAARPGHGKSAIAFQWLDHASQFKNDGMPCLIISEEMGALEIGKRRLSTISTIPGEQWVPASVASMRKEVDEYHGDRAPVYVVEGCNSIDRAEEVIDQFCALHGVGMVAVDYLQLLGSRGKERYEVVTEVSRRVKQITRRNGCRTLLLSQVNRAVESRDGSEPRMSDLRESGQVEQDADLIIFGQWPWKIDSRMDKTEYRLFAAKRRNGPIKEGRMVTRFDPDKQFFGTIDPFGLPEALR